MTAPKKDWARTKALEILKDCNHDDSYNPECLANLITEALRDAKKLNFPTNEEVTAWCEKEMIYIVPISYFYAWLKKQMKVTQEKT